MASGRVSERKASSRAVMNGYLCLSYAIFVAALFVVGAFADGLPCSSPSTFGDDNRCCDEISEERATMEIVNPSCPFTPMPPVWLTAMGQSHSVCLRWAPSPDCLNIQYFKIYHRHDGGDWDFRDRVALVTGTMQYVDNGLADGTTYDYYVTSCGIAVCSFTCTAFIPIPCEHESIPSPISSAIPHSKASPPQNFHGEFVVSPKGNWVSLDWSAPLDYGGFPVAGYHVFRLSSSGTWNKIKQTNATTFSTYDWGYTVDAANHYRVAAFTIDLGTLSDEVVITVPGIPGRISTFSAGQPIRNHVELSWDYPADNGGTSIQGFKVSRSNPDGTWQLVYTLTLTIPIKPPITWMDSNLEYDRTYDYRVTSWNAMGTGPWSLGVSAFITPCAPSGYDFGVHAEGLRANISWYHPVDDGGRSIVSYNVYRGLDSASLTLAYSFAYDALPITIDGWYRIKDPMSDSPALLQPDTVYYYRLGAVNGIGEGLTIVKSITTPADTTAPVANAGPDQEVAAGTEVFLNGTLSSDEFGGSNIASYTWTFADSGTKTLNGAEVSYTFNTPGVYEITLSVRDYGNNVGTDTLVVTVADVNMPVAVAGEDQTVPMGTAVSFDGSSSTDDFGIVGYTWTFVDSGQKSLTGATPSYEFNIPGVYTVTLTVNDDWGNSDTDTLTVTVTDTMPPSTVAGLSGDVGQNQWYTSDVEVTLDSTDLYAGIEWTKYRIDDGSWTAYSSVVIVSDDGEHTIEFYSRDTAGNEEVSGEVTFKVDKTKPAMDISDQTLDEYTEDQATIRWTGSDEGSGIDRYEYSLDGDTYVSVGTATKVTLTGLDDGSHDVVVRGYDMAGNVAEITINFDVNTARGAGLPTSSLLLIVVVVAVVVVAAGSVWVWKFKKGGTPKPPSGNG